MIVLSPGALPDDARQCGSSGCSHPMDMRNAVATGANICGLSGSGPLYSCLPATTMMLAQRRLVGQTDSSAPLSRQVPEEGLAALSGDELMMTGPQWCKAVVHQGPADAADRVETLVVAQPQPAAAPLGVRVTVRQEREDQDPAVLQHAIEFLEALGLHPDVLQDAAADDRIEGLVFIRKAGVVVELRETHGGVLVERGEALCPVDVASTEFDPRAELMADQARIGRVSAPPNRGRRRRPGDGACSAERPRRAGEPSCALNGRAGRRSPHGREPPRKDRKATRRMSLEDSLAVRKPECIGSVAHRRAYGAIRGYLAP